MKRSYLKVFLLRGMLFGGFGPIVVGVVYAILEFAIEGFSLGGRDILLAIVSTYLLAFLQAGASVFNQIEEWSLAKSLLCHFLTLYAAYGACYVLNSWIPFEPIVLVIFTVAFALMYAVIWLTVYICTRGVSKKLNSAIK